MNNEMLQQSVGLLKKMKKDSKSYDSVGELFLSVLGIGVIVLLILAFFVLPLIAYFVWAYAFVAVKLWAWFIVPVFHVAPLTIAQAWGLAIIVSLFSGHKAVNQVNDERETSQKVMEFIILCLYPWLSLLGGWICFRYFL